MEVEQHLWSSLINDRPAHQYLPADETIIFIAVIPLFLKISSDLHGLRCFHRRGGSHHCAVSASSVGGVDVLKIEEMEKMLKEAQLEKARLIESRVRVRLDPSRIRPQ